MPTHLVSEVQYPERNPHEIHYLFLEERESGFYFRAGEVIGKGVASGGGEGKFDITSLLNMNCYADFIRDIECEWIDAVLVNPNLTENEKYLEILDRCTIKNVNI